MPHNKAHDSPRTTTVLGESSLAREIGQDFIEILFGYETPVVYRVRQFENKLTDIFVAVIEVDFGMSLLSLLFFCCLGQHLLHTPVQAVAFDQNRDQILWNQESPMFDVGEV